MSRNDFVYMSQLLWEQEEMGNKITFFKGEMIMKPCPELRFNGKVLIPFDTRWDGSTITLYFPPDTTLPANPITFSDQLLGQDENPMGTP